MIDGEAQKWIEKALEPAYDRLKVGMMETLMRLEEMESDLAEFLPPPTPSLWRRILRRY